MPFVVKKTSCRPYTEPVEVELNKPFVPFVFKKPLSSAYLIRKKTSSRACTAPIKIQLKRCETLCQTL